MNDRMKALLHAWSPAPLAAADIRAGVWQRIEHDKSATAWANLLNRPAFTCGLIVVALVVGLAMGEASSRAVQTKAYLQSVTAYRVMQ